MGGGRPTKWNRIPVNTMECVKTGGGVWMCGPISYTKWNFK